MSAWPSCPGSRLDGYRGMVAVLALIVLVLLGALTGLAPRLVCALDEGACAADATQAPGTATGSVELPAASDELAVLTVPGEATVPSGRGRAVHDRQAPAPAGSAPVVSALWGDEEDAGGLIDPTRLVDLDALACGAPGTGPCDTWEGLLTDTGAALAAGPTRLSQAGLDPFVGQEEAASRVDAVLAPLTAGGAGEVLYRSVQRTRDGLLTESWSWQDGGALYQVVTRRSREGALSSVTAVGVERADGSTVIVRTEVPVTDGSADALEDWLAALPEDRSTVEGVVSDLSGPLDLSAPPAVRAAWRTGVVQRTQVQPAQEVTADVLREHPGGDLPDATVLSTWDLAAADEHGHRRWTPRQAG